MRRARADVLQEGQNLKTRKAKPFLSPVSDVTQRYPRILVFKGVKISLTQQNRPAALA
jgi:hypothetical protein